MMFKNYYLGASDSFTNLLTQRACTEDFPKCLCSFLVPLRERWTPGQRCIHCQERGCSRLLGTGVEQYFVGTEVQKSQMGRREQFQSPLSLTWHSITHIQYILACPMFWSMVWKLHLQNTDQHKKRNISALGPSLVILQADCASATSFRKIGVQVYSHTNLSVLLLSEKCLNLVWIEISRS